MSHSSWTASPDELGMFDSAVVRCIAGELPEDSLASVAGIAGVDLRRRMAGLMSKHCAMRCADLARLGSHQRRRLANEIVAAELDERETSPGALVPLRPLRRV